MVPDLLSLLLASIPIYVVKNPGGFRLAVLAGVLLAGLCWYLCAVYAHIWNTRFHVTVTQHVLCAFASALTLCTVVLFASLACMKDAAILSIALWQVQLGTDRTWAAETFVRAYEGVREIGLEDFSRVPPPGAANAFIPTTNDRSRQTAASIYADEACRHFDRKRPFLSRIVWTSPGVPADTIFRDVRHWHETNPDYPPSRAIQIAADRIQAGLDPQAPRIVHLARMALLVLFVFIQAVPAGLIGWAAHRDIKVTV